jgi:SAM-dependent methyltransferase
MTDFTKAEFQSFWPKGYYENFGWGVGLETVVNKTLVPFFDSNKTALEIGCGGGVFTERIVGKFHHVYAIDVIKKPESLDGLDITFIEIPDRDFTCYGIEDNSIDFCFSYGVFCHLSNSALIEYFDNVYRILKPGGDFVFMISFFEKLKKQHPNFEDYSKYELGNRMEIGHFVQDERTVNLIVDKRWKMVNENMIPDHRDLIVHIRK